MAPRVLAHPGTRPTESEALWTPPVYAPPSTEVLAEEERLELRLLEERCEVRERVLRLRRKLAERN